MLRQTLRNPYNPRRLASLWLLARNLAMSLQPTHTSIVPAQTARVAQAACPTGTRCLHLDEHLGTLLQAHDFADLFPRRRQPAAAPCRVALVTVRQFVEGLSDRAAADAVRGRLAWQDL